MDFSPKIRNVPHPEGGRIETGPVQFGDDWPGVFIRGDNAFAYAMLLQILLDESDATTGKDFDLTTAQLRGLVSDLKSCLPNSFRQEE